MDVSFNNEDASIACAGIVIYEVNHRDQKVKCVYTHCHYVRLNAPFITSFLVFREYNAYNELLSLLPPHLLPQLVCFDGNGQFHEIKFGMACHIGVLHNFASIGLSKSFSYLTQYRFGTKPHFEDDAHIEEFVREKQMQKNDSCPIRAGNNDGETLAIMYVNSDDDRVPVFISAGHRIAIDTCLEFFKCLSVWQENIETIKSNKKAIVFKRDSHVPLLIDHADKMTRRAIIDLDKNEILFKY
jgi:deoxyinosine 3'endonuclease (endonuclease V)